MKAGDRTFKKKNSQDIVINIILLIGVVIFLFPFYISITTAVKTQLETAASVMAFPHQICWDNFTEAIRVTKFWNSFLNSLIVTVTSVLLIVICSSMAGYIISRNIRKKSFKLWEYVLLTFTMVPFQVVMIPLYRMLLTMGLNNTLYGLAIVLVGTSIPYSSFLYIGFVKTVPIELEESAIVDGCGLFRKFWQIVFPLLKPVTSSVAALHVLWMWNEFNASLIILQKESVKTIPINQYYFFGQYTTNLNMAFASACITMVPVLLFFILSQKFIIQGLTAGALKG